jgi:hypothetical protein
MIMSLYELRTILWAEKKNKNKTRASQKEESENVSRNENFMSFWDLVLDGFGLE